MKRLVTILAVLLAAQLGLAVFLNGNWLAPVATEQKTLDFTAASLDAIEITSADGVQVKLRAGDKHWLIESSHDLPVDAEILGHLFSQLDGLKNGPVVAESVQAHARFRVAANAFERRVVLIKDKKTLATVYIGTVASRGRTHVRLEGSNVVREMQLAAYDAPGTQVEWLDKLAMAVSPAKVLSFQLGSDLFTRQGEAWQLNGAPSDKADKLMQALSSLRVTSVLDAEDLAKLGDEPPVLEISLTDQDGVVRVYRLSKLDQNINTYALKVSDVEPGFLMDSAQAAPLLKAAE